MFKKLHRIDYVDNQKSSHRLFDLGPDVFFGRTAAEIVETETGDQSTRLVFCPSFEKKNTRFFWEFVATSDFLVDVRKGLICIPTLF